MSIVEELEEEIQKLHEKIDAIQSECNHLKSCLTVRPGSSTGNWDKDDEWERFYLWFM